MGEFGWLKSLSTRQGKVGSWCYPRTCWEGTRCSVCFCGEELHLTSHVGHRHPLWVPQLHQGSLDGRPSVSPVAPSPLHRS